MNKQTVGMENLPNVYIDKIISEPRVVSRTPLRIQYNVKVFVKMYDHVNHSWYNKIPGLKVKCAFVSDDRIDQLNNGEISLYDIPLGALNKATARLCDDFRFSDRRGNYETYTTKFEFNTLTAPENLNVYVACFIDDLNFGINLFDKFYGPMAAERIFVAGQHNSESGYFYYPDTNEEYGGPVHAHEQGYMEGSEHSSDAHSELVYVPEENYKITSIPEDLYVSAGMDLTRTPEENRQEYRPGYVDSDPDDRGLGPQTNIPDEEVSIEDSNVPSGPLTEIY